MDMVIYTYRTLCPLQVHKFHIVYILENNRQEINNTYHMEMGSHLIR